MTRATNSHFDSFDPEVIEAARDVANRAGVPLESWIASVAPQHFAAPDPAPRRSYEPDPAPSETVAKTSDKTSTDRSDKASTDRSDKASTDRSEEAPVAEPAPKAAPVDESSEEPAPAASDGFAALMTRLDGLDRSMETERRAAAIAEQRRLEEIEQRIDRALQGGPVQQVTERLGDIERRVAQLGDQVAATRTPPKQRGKAAASDMREAVQAIRQRQRELSGQGEVQPPAASAVATMHRDLVRRLGSETVEAAPAPKAAPMPKAATLGSTSLGTANLGSAATFGNLAAIPAAEPAAARGPSSLPAYVIDELKREAGGLRDTLAVLATDADIEDLDKALDSMAANIGRARSDADVPAIALPLAVIRTRIEELDGATANGAAYAKVATGMKRFAQRLDVAAAFEEPDAERTILNELLAEREEFRSVIGTLAAPEKIKHLSLRVQDLEERLAQIQVQAERQREAVEAERQREAAEAERQREIVEAERKRRATETAEAERAQAEMLRLAAEEEEDEDSELAGEISALANRVDSLQAEATVKEVVQAEAGKMDPNDVASIHAMLRSLAEKVDRVGARKGPENLDALEKQVLTLVDKIETPSALDPALTSLERTMTDLMKQVESLRDMSPSEAIIQRAARTAVAETIKGANPVANQGEFGLLRASLADMQARQIASDERLSSTLEGVQTALDRLVNRLGAVESAPAPRAPSLDERLLASTSSDVARGSRRTPPRETVETPVAGEALLEPGAPRPTRGPSINVEKRELSVKAPVIEKAADKSAADADIKTSFIAAARRAAQAAQAELAAEAPLDRQTARGRSAPIVVPETGKMGKMRAEIDQHRKPLLLGLAAVVLTLGAIQAVGLRSGEEPRTLQLAQAPATTASIDKLAEKPLEQALEAQKPAPAPQQMAEAPKAAQAPAPQPAQPAQPAQDPSTTQALSAPKAPELPPAPTKAGIPPVSGMNGLAGDLSNVPPALAKVKQAALTGDGTAVWELAMREADGRGMPRDLATATKLFDKLATAGYAPAQYKLGAHYEKGSGVARDLEKAKLWYGRAAEQGHARAMHNLGVIFAENPSAGGKPDFATAASWFRQGAEHGVRDSQYNIAVLYARGLGLTQDLVQSYAWFNAAAAQGDDDAGKKRDDVATKLSAPDLARAKNLASSFKPRKLDGAVNDPPVIQDGQGPMSLLGAPAPASLAHPGKAI